MFQVAHPETPGSSNPETRYPGIRWRTFTWADTFHSRAKLRRPDHFTCACFSFWFLSSILLTRAYVQVQRKRCSCLFICLFLFGKVRNFRKIYWSMLLWEVDCSLDTKILMLLLMNHIFFQNQMHWLLHFSHLTLIDKIRQTFSLSTSKRQNQWSKNGATSNHS